MNLEKRIDDKAVEYLYSNVPSVVAGQLFMYILVAIILWSDVNKIHMLIWVLSGVTVGLIRYFLYYYYFQNRKSITNPAQWGNYYALASLGVGVTFGFAVILFFDPNNFGRSAFILTVVLGYSAGGFISNAYWMRSIYFLTIPLLVITALRVSLEGKVEFIGTAIFIIVYLLLAIKYSKNTNKSFMESIRLQITNFDLSKQFQEQKEIADEANISKSKFLAAASHDIRQPLHAMGLFANLLQKELDNKIQIDLFTKVSYSLDALRKLLNTLLDVSKLDAGIVHKNLEHFHLNRLLDRLNIDFSTEAKEKGLTYYYPTAKIINEIVVFSDVCLCELILRNLLSNAIRYTDTGSVGIKINKLTGSVIRVDIIDTGISIPEEKQQKIFQEFIQLNNPERDRVKGLGLGLAIVNRLVKLLDHKIEIKSKKGQGTIFSFFVPLGKANKIKKLKTYDIIEMNNSIKDTSIIVIDDDTMILDGMKKMLEQWGCKVIVAKSEQEALNKIKHEKFTPDVIIADYRLRENKTGAEAIAGIRRTLATKVPALIITGDTAPERLREALKGNHALLHKPVQPAQIIAFLRNLSLKE